MRHEIEIRRGDYAPYWCGRCEWQWQSRPTGECPGIKRYSAATPTLKSRSQWKRLKRQVAGKPAGVVWTAYEWMTLYAESATVPFPPPSEAERQALREEWRRRRTCQGCGKVMPRVSDLDDRGYCASCGGNWMTQDEMRIAHAFDAAVWWARDLLDLPAEQWGICDTETTALNGECIQVAIIAGDGTMLLDRLIHPLGTDSPGAFAIHHISDDDLRIAPPFPACYAAIKAALRERKIVFFSRVQLVTPAGLPSYYTYHYM